MSDFFDKTDRELRELRDTYVRRIIKIEEELLKRTVLKVNRK